MDNNIKPRAIALMGPTATGKTAAALALAQQLPCEIISVDSALIYRDMDIGSAKPSLAERAAVPHHLIDIIDPADSYSVARFRIETLKLVDEITARGRLPLLVGGTMMYFKVLMEGLGDLPPADREVRAQLDAEILEHGIGHLHAKLAELDPVTAQRLPPGDTQRIQRAMEIMLQTGQKLSVLFDQQHESEPALDLLALSLEPSDRAVLHRRIEQRFSAMLAQGFLEEVRALKARGDLDLTMPSMRCVGYRQAWEYLDGTLTFEQFQERGVIATRQLAKRQLTWLRSMQNRFVIDCLASNVNNQITEHVRQFNALG